MFVILSYFNESKKQKPILISIEGNICDKNTLTTIISQLLKDECEIISEPVNLLQTITDL